MPASERSTQSAFSSRWNPVQASSGTSFARASISGSRSPNASATGSIASYGSRAHANVDRARSWSPASTAAVNTRVRATS